MGFGVKAKAVWLQIQAVWPWTNDLTSLKCSYLVSGHHSTCWDPLHWRTSCASHCKLLLQTASLSALPDGLVKEDHMVQDHVPSCHGPRCGSQRHLLINIKHTKLHLRVCIPGNQTRDAHLKTNKWKKIPTGSDFIDLFIQQHFLGQTVLDTKNTAVNKDD